MKAQTNLFVQRTQNDTDVLSFILQVITDDGTVNVADADTVVLHVKTTAGVKTITGTAKGDSSGTFYFSSSEIRAFAAVMLFEIQVTQFVDGVIYTIGRGVINSRPEIG